MRKLTLLLSVLLLAVTAFAKQATNAGSYILGGEMIYSVETIKYDSYECSSLDGDYQINCVYKTLILAPESYWFMVDNFAVGGILQIIKQKDTYESDYYDEYDEDEYLSFSLNPGCKYFFDVNHNLSINAFVNYSIGFYSNDGDELESTDENILQLGVSADYFITSHIAVEPYLQFNKSFYSDSDGFKRNSIDFGCKLAIFLFN